MVQKIAVIGAGIMGSGIAYSASIAGFQTKLYDIDRTVLEKAKIAHQSLANNSYEKSFITTEQRAAVSTIAYETELSHITDVDLIIEAVVERIDVKSDLFAQLDAICPPHVILATNTSSLSPTEIGAATTRPDRVIAMHFFNPVHKMKLIEIIKGLDTSEETLAVIQRVSEQLGKESVVVNEFPGFVTSRMNAMIGNEAMNMLLEGVASAEDIDKAIKLGLNHPMGPLEMGDVVGLDTRLRTLQYLHETLGEKYRPSPLLVKYVKAGRLGRKTGIGVYNYKEDEKYARK
jgi:3-hydroxybutyryl-CoA dehydrogenase